MNLRPMLLSVVVIIPAIVLGWGFHAERGIIGLAHRIGDIALGALAVVAGGGAIGLLRHARNSGSNAPLPAVAGFAGTAVCGLVAATALFRGESPASWLSLPGAICAAIAAGGMALLGILEAQRNLTDKQPNAALGLLYGVAALIAAGAAVRLVL
jgi:hypothetical protein